MGNIRRLDDNRWEVPIGSISGMRVHGIIYASARLISHLEQQAIAQVANTATLPGIVKASMAMPDIHTGYGFPIGGVAAFDMHEGVVSPGGVGYDINCGVRLLKTNLMKHDAVPRMKDLVSLLYSEIPSGVGSKGRLKLSLQDERKLLLEGARWSVANGYGDAADLEHTESGGALDGADPDEVSEKAYERGRAQQGTLGAGNHFLEVQYVDEIFDQETANTFGLFEGQVTVMIHSGSRGFGHQVCTDFLGVMDRAAKKYDIALPDRELACAPVDSEEARRYLAAMRAAANYAWANRQLMMHWTREVFMAFFKMPRRALGLDLLYDVAHNIAKTEFHMVDGEKRELMVHRKGATRAFAPGHPELPEVFRKTGQPVLIPGDMGRASYVMAGTERAMAETFGSTCHGAGRIMSRHQAMRQAKGRAIWRELEDRGIYVRSAGRHTLAEEMSEAYKDVSDVVDVVHDAGISRKVARLCPMGVVKG
ncbi:MAG: RtcB family protein [Nitrospirae bacterium]|nr:RtcB family protein [Nitrospirota bacterium]